MLFVQIEVVRELPTPLAVSVGLVEIVAVLVLGIDQVRKPPPRFIISGQQRRRGIDNFHI